MSETQAKVVLTADDQASGVISKAAQSFDQLQQSTGKAASGLGEFNLSSIATIATGVSLANVAEKVVSTMIELGKASLEAADDMNAIHNRAEALFGQDFPAMSAQAEQLAASFGRNSTQILDFETHISAVGESLGVSTKLSEQMSVGLSGLAENIGKAFHTDAADVLHSLEMALEGNVRGLRQYDIAMSSKTLQEYADAEGIKVKLSAMDSEQKAILTYHYLMEKTKAIQEAAAKDTGDLSDREARLTAEWTKLEENIGSVFLPVAELAVTALTYLLKGFNLLGDGIGLVTTDIENATAALVHFLGMDTTKSYAGSKLTGKDLSAEDVPHLQMSAKLKQSSKAQEDWAKGWADNSDAASKAAQKHLDEVKVKLDELNAKYEQNDNALADKLSTLDETHKNKVQSIKDSIQSLQEKLKDLKASFQDSMDGIVKSEEDALTKSSGKIDQLKQKLADLQLRAEQENRRGSVSVQTNTDLERTQKELTKEQTSFTTHLGQMTPDQQATVAKREGMTDLDRYFADKKAEAAKLTAKEGDSEADLAQQINKKNTEMATENENYDKQTNLIQNTEGALKSWHDSLVYLMEHADQVTTKTLTNMQRQFDAINKNLTGFSKIIGADKSSSVAPGPATSSSAPAPTPAYVPTGYDLSNPNYIAAVSGSQDSLLSAGATSRVQQQAATAVSIQIHMGQVTVHSQADIDALVSQLARQIQLQQAGVN